MRRGLVVLLVMVLCMGALIPTMAMENMKTERQNYLVGFKGEVNKGLIKAFGVEEDALLKEYSTIPTMLLSLTETQAKALAKHPKIDYVEIDAEVYALSQTVPWGVAHVQGRIAHNSGFTGNNVKVAVLDTGIDAYHEDLKVYGGYSIFTDKSNSDPFYDGNSHGTHIAGIIAALDNNVGVVGVAPSAHLYSVKVLNNSGSGTISGVVTGIEWSIVNGMNIVNMSLGGSTGSSSLESMCQSAYNAGLILVAPVGSSGNNSPSYPAIYPTVIGVGAVSSNNQRASFSSYGPSVELVAPGVNILSTIPGNSYSTRNGTSLAAAHVSGVAALVKGAKPTLTNVQIRNSLNATALNIGDPQIYGNGLVQAMNAINYALSMK